MSSLSLPYFSGSASAASTTSAIFLTCLPDAPAKAPTLSRVCPASLVETFLECLPGAVPPCSRCRSFAAALSTGSRARRMASISLGRKSLRWAFSANSPRTISSRLTMVTGISLQPSCLQAAIRRAPRSEFIGADDDWIHQAHDIDACGQTVYIAKIVPVPVPDLDGGGGLVP